MTNVNPMLSAFALTPAQPFAAVPSQLPDVHVALMVRLESKPACVAEVAKLLRAGRGLVAEETGTPYWFAIQISPTTFGIFDAFPGPAERNEHLDGALAKELLAKAPELLASPPVIDFVAVVGHKHAFAGASRDVRYGIVARVTAKPEHAADVAALWSSGAAVVAEEPGTPLWFGVKVDATTFAIFDAFETIADRDAHLRGRLAQALGASGDLLAAPPTIEPVDVIAMKIP